LYSNSRRGRIWKQYYVSNIERKPSDTIVKDTEHSSYKSIRRLSRIPVYRNSSIEGQEKDWGWET
jgi:hypothetical protein